MNAHAPIAAEAGGWLGRAEFPPGFRYLLLLRTDARRDPLKPMAFHDLGHLARHLVTAATAAGGVQFYDQRLMFAGEFETRAGVSCWTLDPASGDRRTFLGWAWVNGAGRETLTAALQRARPEARA